MSCSTGDILDNFTTSISSISFSFTFKKKKFNAQYFAHFNYVIPFNPDSQIGLVNAQQNR